MTSATAAEAALPTLAGMPVEMVTVSFPPFSKEKLPSRYTNEAMLNVAPSTATRRKRLSKSSRTGDKPVSTDRPPPLRALKSTTGAVSLLLVPDTPFTASRAPVAWKLMMSSMPTSATSEPLALTAW